MPLKNRRLSKHKQGDADYKAGIDLSQIAEMALGTLCIAYVAVNKDLVLFSLLH
jgi:hypothetical protein